MSEAQMQHHFDERARNVAELQKRIDDAGKRGVRNKSAEDALERLLKTPLPHVAGTSWPPDPAKARAAVFGHGAATDPVTGKPIERGSMVPNVGVEQAIREFLKQRDAGTK